MDATQVKPAKEVDPYSAFPFKKVSFPKSPQDGRGAETTFQPIHLQFSSSAPFTPTYINSNLSLSSDPAAAYSTRVKGKHLLLDNPSTTSMSEGCAKQEQKVKERKEKNKARKAARDGLGARPKRPRVVREKGLWRLNESQAKCVVVSLTCTLGLTNDVDICVGIICFSQFIIFGWGICPRCLVCRSLRRLGQLSTLQQRRKRCPTLLRCTPSWSRRIFTARSSQVWFSASLFSMYLRMSPSSTE